MHRFDIDEIAVGLVRLDDEDRVVAVNEHFRQWSGIEDAVGRPISELIEPVEDFLHIAGALSRLMVSRADPARAAFVARSTGPGDSVLTLWDASDRYEVGHRLRVAHTLAERTRDRLELIIDASIAFSAASDETRLGEILATTAARSYVAEEAVVYVFGEDDRRLRRLAGVNPLEPIVSEPMLAAAVSGLRDVVKISGEAEAAAVSPFAAQVLRETGVHAVLAAPLRADSTVLGFFACFFKHPRSFDQEAAPLAEALAGQAGQALAAIRFQRRLEHAALHDETTGLPNRRFLEERMSVPHGSGVSVMFIDLDRFKAINDGFGHQLGDDVLREVAQRLASAVREEDVVARYGGDEFVAVCVADASTAMQIAERIVAALAEPLSFLPDHVLSASVGVASLNPGDDLTVDRLIRLADYAMYFAKAGGGNRVVPAAMVSQGVDQLPASIA